MIAVRQLLLLLALTLALHAAGPESESRRKSFLVKQVTPGAVYLDGGSAHGLAEGMRLNVERREPGAAQMAARRVCSVVIVAVATQSALAQIQAEEGILEPEAGDSAALSPQDEAVLALAQSASRRQRFVQVIAFTGGDPLEEEVREYVPMAPPDEVGRKRGSIGFEFNTITDRTSRTGSHQEGVSARIDWTRINGTYWRASGYWRGRWNTRRGSLQQQSLTDLINRTYTMGLFYENPRSRNQLGFGRILLPWASSLSTIDGGYFARRLARHVTAGIFAGSTPDPTQWNYDPNRQMVGVFTSFDQGSYEKVRWTGTVGAAASRVHWRPERNFLFVENTLYAGAAFSVIHSMEADLKNARFMNGETGAMLSRSFLTARIQPSRRFSFDLNQNYFRGLPTFDTSLIGTGLLDKYLFEGFSAGVRALPWSRLVLSANWGRSTRNGDSKSSLNQMYGAGWTRLPYLGARVDARYTRFSSSFGQGSYESISLIRELGDNLRVELMLGQQDFAGFMTRQSRSRFVNGQAEWNLGLHHFLSAGWLSYRGAVQDYDQMYFTVGYRF